MIRQTSLRFLKFTSHYSLLLKGTLEHTMKDRKSTVNTLLKQLTVSDTDHINY